MTDTPNKNTESCTGYRTPETDEAKFWSDYHGHYVVFADRAGDFEHERDEALFDLAFRRDLYKLQENQLDEMRNQLAEAVSSCHIWQSGHSELVDDRNRWVSLASVRREEYLQAATLVNELNKELAILRKQNAERLTLLQEHGLAEYGN